MKPRSFALLIVGMHRSGTSFLGECCGALGYTLPRDAGGPASDNPRGHFEPRAVVALNDDLMARSGALWHRIAPLDLPRPDRDVITRMDAAVAESFGDADRIMIKDPRLSLTLPLWRAWLDARDIPAAVLIALRDPRAAAQSLARRDGIAPEAGMLSWIAHTLGSIEGTEGMPRLLVPFPEWTRAPQAMLDRIASLGGHPVPPAALAAVKATFVPGAIHELDDAEVAEGPVEALAMRLFGVLSDAAARDAEPPVARIAALRARFDTISAAARGIEAAHAAAHRDARKSIDAMATRQTDLERDVAQRTADAALLQEQVARTEAQRDDAVTALQQQLGETERQRDQGLAAAADRLAATEAQRDEMMQQAEQLRSRLVEAEHQRATLDAQLAATEAQRDEMMQRADELRSGLAEAENHRAALDALLAATEAQRDEMMEVADGHFATITSLEQQLDHARAHIDTTEKTLAETLAWLERERMSILKPLYRRFYRTGGRALRTIAPSLVVEQLKRRLPVPGGIPRALAFTPLPTPGAPAQSYATVPPATGGKPDIFVLSIIGWDFRTQRPQHLATEMAAAGHRVFYIEMEQEHGPGTAREVAPGVHVIRLPSRGTRTLAAYTGVPTMRQARAWVDHFHALADSIGASSVAHVVIEHPYWWNLARHLSPQYQITFDCMDDIGGFSNTEPHVLDAEMDMIARADKVVVSSQYLYEKFVRIRPVAMVRNGTDVSHFIRDPDEEPAPQWLPGRPTPGSIRVGYVGAIAEWFDTDLLEDVARANPDFDIHLCGAVTAQPPLRLAELPNVTLHGEIPYRDVPAFHKQMDVLIIPFQLLPIIKACDPVKFYEYSAVMRPTVSTSLPELDRAGDLVFRADRPDAFALQIRRAAPLARDAEFGARLRQYAIDNAWSFRAADMLAEMRNEPRLSVVVLHYGADTGLTEATLHAMLGRGEVYPNLEVVLVDNGSSPEVLSVLRERAAADSRIVLIENDENLGFAKGNNRGIEAASGEFVLLLNNDTFLAPGALLAMVRHLQRNPQIGIVGPLTNNIGNEARIEIGYRDMDEMAARARGLATGHRGQLTPIAVCAYFCAMFRRADLDRLGTLPEVYGRGMFEDDDHCATFRAAGLDTALAEDAFCHHHLSATFDALEPGEKQSLFQANKAIFEARWGTWIPHRYRATRPEPTLTR